MRLRVISTKYLNNEDIEKYLVNLKHIKQIYTYKLIQYTEIIKNVNQIAVIMPEYSNSLASINPVEYLTESSQYRIIYAVAKALSRLHTCGIVHSSLHPGNVLLNKENKIVLTDYGINELMINSEENFIITKPKVCYLSPEIIENKEISMKSDIWSIGCVIFYISNGKHIFDGKTVFEIEKKIIKNEKSEPTEKYNKNVNELISKLLKINPFYRLDVRQIASELDSIFKLDINDEAICNTLNNSNSGGKGNFSVNSNISSLNTTLINNLPIFMSYNNNNSNSEERNNDLKNEVVNKGSIFVSLRPSRTSVLTKDGVIKFQSGEIYISNCLYYNETNGAVVIGETAKELIKERKNKRQVIYNTLNFIGLNYHHPIVEECKKLYNYKIKNENGYPKIRILYGDDELSLSPTDILCEVLKYVKKTADEILHHNVYIPTKAYIAVPSNFTIYQMEEVGKAAENAYLKVEGIYLETIAYHLKEIDIGNNEESVNEKGKEKENKNERFMICDFKRSYYEISVVNINTTKMNYSLLFNEKNYKISGNSFDEAIADFFIQRYEENTTKLFDKEKHHHTTKELIIASEECKIDLIKNKYNIVEIDSDLLEEENVDCAITTDDLCEISVKYVERVSNYVDSVLMKCNINEDDMKKVYLVGESSRIPKYQEMMENKFKNIKFIDQIDVLSSLNEFYDVKRLNN